MSYYKLLRQKIFCWVALFKIADLLFVVLENDKITSLKIFSYQFVISYINELINFNLGKFTT